MQRDAIFIRTVIYQITSPRWSKKSTLWCPYLSVVLKPVIIDCLRGLIDILPERSILCLSSCFCLKIKCVKINVKKKDVSNVLCQIRWANPVNPGLM